MLNQTQKDKIAELYQEGYSIADITEQLKHGKNTINRFLQKAGIVRGKNKFNEETEKQIIQEYLAGNPESVVGEKYGCDRVTIGNILKRHDVDRRPRGNSFKEISQETKDLIAKMWEEGKSRWEITNELKMGHDTLDRYLTEMGVEIENRFRTEPGPNWQGGRTIDSKGYVLVFIRPDDPFYSMADAKGYIRENRYVMAKHLNSILPENDTVHHMDGNKLDNSLSNLELRKGSHPPGIAMQCNDCNSYNIVALPLQRTDYTNKSDVKLPEKSKFSDEVQKQIVQEHGTGISISALARKYDAGRITIRNVLLRAKVKLTKYHDGLTLNKEEFTEMWMHGELNSKIRDHFDISKSTLNRWVKNLDLPLRRTSASAENHGNWKGGKTKANGYASIFVAKDDPLFCMANRYGYIPEHRYIMAKHLGRPLTENEEVHHKEDKISNAIEDLQLVIKNHGRGRRFECGDCHSINLKAIPLG